MSKLEKWLPFKFFRKLTGEGNEVESDAPNADTPPKRPAPPDPAPALVPRGLMSPPMADLVNAFFHAPMFGDPFGAMGRWPGGLSGLGVGADIVDEAEAVRVDLQIPGMGRDDVALTVDDGALVVRGEKRDHQERAEAGVFHSASAYGFVQRTIPLPHHVDRTRGAATLKDGVLSVRFPKLEAPPPPPSTTHQIPVH